MDAAETRALIPNIALQRGAHLEMAYCGRHTGLNDILTGISTTHLSNLPSPAFIEYQIHPREIQLFGPNGRFSFIGSHVFSEYDPFVEFPLLPLANVRELRLRHCSQWSKFYPKPPTLPLAFFPALETLSIEGEANILHRLSTLLSNPSSSPSLKTLAFLDCDISSQFMEELKRFASDRKNTTSARLHHVIIVDSGGKFPSTGSIDWLKEHIPTVDVRRGTMLPADLTRSLEGQPNFSVVSDHLLDQTVK